MPCIEFQFDTATKTSDIYPHLDMDIKFEVWLYISCKADHKTV